MRIFAAFAAVALLIVGCSALGLSPAQNTQQQIAYGYSGVTAALNTLASATSSGVVSSSEATQVNAAILVAKGMLDQANAAVTSNQPTAIKLLTAATQSLATVSAYLACKQQKGPQPCLLSQS